MPDLQTIRAQQSLMQAIRLSIAVSGLPDKRIYMDLDIEPAQWSRIKSGLTHFPVDKLPGLMRITGDHAPLLWLAYTMGYDESSLRPTEAELQRQVIELTRENERMKAERQAERRFLQDMLGGRAAA